jgi:hypothetical protein
MSALQPSSLVKHWSGEVEHCLGGWSGWFMGSIGLFLTKSPRKMKKEMKRKRERER